MGYGGAAAMRTSDGGVALPQAALRLLGVLWSVAASRLFAAVLLGCCGRILVIMLFA